jgi:hypothetical protein
MDKAENEAILNRRLMREGLEPFVDDTEPIYWTEPDW